MNGGECASAAMKQKNNIQVVQRRGRNMHRLYRELLEEFGEDTIHDFRLEIKKLRAFLRMKRSGKEGKQKLQIPKKLHRFYNAVGEVRNCQLQKKLVLQYCKDSGAGPPLFYLQMLHVSEEAAKQKARDAALQFSMTEYRQHLLKTIHRDNTTHDAKRFVEEKKRELSRCLSAVVISDADIHQVRKIFKDLLYVWPWIMPYMAGALPGEKFSKESCAQLTEKLGEFQDLCTALNFLQPPIISTIPDAAEQQVLQQLFLHCQKRKVALREEICAQLSTLNPSQDNKAPVSQTEVDPATAIQ